VLEGESGFNDPVGITLMVAAVLIVTEPAAGFADGLVRFVEELSIGLAGGIVGALVLTVLLRVTPRLEDNVQAVTVLTAAVIVGAATAVLHGSGFLAVYVSGLLIADQWSRQDGRHHAIPQATAGVSEAAVLGLLGAAFAPMIGAPELWHGVVLTLITVAAIRPAVVWVCLIGSKLARAERVLVTLGGLKGAVPLLLAAYPALEGLDEASTTEATVLVATAASILVQGGSLRFIAGRAGQLRSAS
jgi:cell volume regulation protein A